MKTALVLSATVLITTMYAAAQPQHFEGKTLWHHVEVLADDDMEGRGTGAPGLERAQAYVVDQLEKAGLTPAGVNGFFQPVRIEQRRILDCTAALVRDGRVAPLTLGEDAACTTFVDNAPSVEAPLVFLGYGLKVPEAGYDEFAGLDLKGKIAVTIPGAPPGIDSALIAQHAARRWDYFRDAGLIGWIFITAPTASWTSLAAGTVRPRTHLTGDLDETHGAQLMMYFNPARVDKLFEGTGHTASEVFELDKARKPLPRMALPVSVRATARMSNTPIASSNVIAKLEGSDPRLRSEHVVLSAHLDAQGIGTPVNGDRIYNGAFDNATGVAALLEIAARLASQAERPKRSILFAFLTAHEGGLLGGSKYFVAHPTVDRKSIVANVNIDIIHAIVPLTTVGVIGMEESDLGDAGRRAAAAHGIAADAEKELRFAAFSRTSDTASFALAGIPAVMLKVGFPGEMGAVLESYRKSPYHTPSDDLQQPVNLETLAKFESVARATLLDIANNPRRPEWKSGSLYNRYAK